MEVISMCYLGYMNERSLQDILEWVVLGLLAAVGVLAVMWIGGILFTALGHLLALMAGVIWTLLKLLIPILLVAATIYFVLRFIQKPNSA